jgi:hypothetical protein
MDETAIEEFWIQKVRRRMMFLDSLFFRWNPNGSKEKKHFGGWKLRVYS